MTTTKQRVSSKILVVSIVAVIILSLLISPFMAITANATTSSDALYSDEFKGYGEAKTKNITYRSTSYLCEELKFQKLSAR